MQAVSTQPFSSEYQIQNYYQNMVVINDDYVCGLCTSVENEQTCLFVCNTQSTITNYYPLAPDSVISNKPLGVYINPSSNSNVIANAYSTVTDTIYIYGFNPVEDSAPTLLFSALYGNLTMLSAIGMVDDNETYYCLGINHASGSNLMCLVGYASITTTSTIGNVVTTTSNLCLLPSTNNMYNIFVTSGSLSVARYNESNTYQDMGYVYNSATTELLTASFVASNLVYANGYFYTIYQDASQCYIIGFEPPTAAASIYVTPYSIPNTSYGLTYYSLTNLMYFLTVDAELYSYDVSDNSIQSIVQLSNVINCTSPLSLNDQGIFYGMGEIDDSEYGTFSFSLVPSNLTITSAVPTTNSIQVFFDVDTFDAYPVTSIQYSTNGGNEGWFNTTSSVSSPLTIVGLHADTTYTIVLRATNEIGTSSSSNAVVVKTLVPIANICFVEGTLVQTDQGHIPIQELRPEFHTIHNTSILAITKTLAPSNDFLVVIQPHALGYRIPYKKTIMSPLHKVFYNNKWIEARTLLQTNKYCSKITLVFDANTNNYLYNVLMRTHSTMNVHGMLVETLHPQNIIARLYQSPDCASFQEIAKQCSFSLLTF